MKTRIAILFLISFNWLFSQEERRHVVFFETDQYVVLPTEESRLLLFLSEIESLDIEKISIYGFCDDTGGKNYNLRLSQYRANSIKTIFSNNEFDETKISNVDGKGEVLLKVIDVEDIVKIRGLNRKVEIRVKPHSPPRKEANLDKPKKKGFAEAIMGDIKAGDKFLLENILFKTGYSVLLPESKKTLEQIAKALLKRNDIYFTIQGHVCCTQNRRDAVDRGTNKQNLSLIRAKYIYDYLVQKGVDRERMKFVGMRGRFRLGGEAKYDRRVEILLTYVEEND
ncbi:OmpA family protein [Bizionia argentinensis JUB59]|uniref:OmpA family protein n=1 Tax=Bizionia argentinensis JUB59 TaxID=1046627 RepID=G2EED5_9FLAO|nr:OmpA family protein [Bizionia argentinensis]EGV43175.1 OmpA family protein [Bizionia argentinensis JUB59]